jgi:hypothetical protein
MKKQRFSAPQVYLVLLALLVGAAGAIAKDPQNRKKPARNLQKSAVLEHTFIDGNRINDIAMNNGQYVSHTVTGNSGMEWPIGSHHLIDYASGIWLAGKASGSGNIYTAAAEYAVEFAPGKILPSGQPDDANLAKYKWYKIERADFTNPTADFTNWPFDDGAPALRTWDDSADSLDGSGNRIPMLLGDQTLWCVFNDADPGEHGAVFGTPPMGVEVQLTVWTYNRPDAFGDMFFAKAKLIHKGTVSFDSTFIALWDDPDLGDASDDYVGCDTSLSLGYCWNATNNDADYGAAPPTIGRDFFQGPIVPSPGDTANVSGKKIPGYKNLPMYSFAYYINGAVYPYQDPASSQELFNYMTGKYQDGSPFIDPITSSPTRFAFPGDPVANSGWTETNPSVLSPGDRRLLMSCGPFSFAPGDTQEVVFGILISRGSSNLQSVALLKQNDAVAQLAYDINFQLPASPPPVNVTVGELDGEITLYWDDDAESYTAVDLIDRDPGGATTQYDFEGYIVYQLNAPSAGTATEIKRLAVYDIVNGVTEIQDLVFEPKYGEQILATVVKGTDGGISRKYSTSMDQIAGLPLVNNRPYYYAVVAYGYNQYGIPKFYEAPLQVMTVYPHAAPPGSRYNSVYGDTITSTHTGPGDGGVLALVTDPSKVTGDTYTVTFAADPSSPGSFLWNLNNTTKGTVALANQSHQSIEGDGEYSVAEGLQVKVLGPPPGMKSWGIPTGARRFSWAGGFLLGLEGFWPAAAGTEGQDRDNGTRGMAANLGFGGIGTNLGPTDYHTVLIRLAAVDTGALWDPLVVPTDANISRGYRYLRAATATPGDPSVVPWIINATAGYPYQDFNYSVPFSAWDMSTTPPTRLTVGFLENNMTAAEIATEGKPYLDGRYWPGDAGTGNSNGRIREFFFVFATPYSTTPDPALQVRIDGNSNIPLMWVYTGQRRGPESWPGGDEFQINSYNVNTNADTYNFTTAGKGVAKNTETAKADIGLINVVPNPYLGSSPLEVDPQNRFVTFTRLPNDRPAKIRIFSLAGVLVRVLDHTSNSTLERWDLRNADGIPVASGMYLAHVEIEGLGVKVVKLGVIQPEERLDRL